MKLNGKWKKLSNSIYESSNGTRIHLMGVIRCQKTIFINETHWFNLFYNYELICGGNRKRALMLMAENISDLEC